MYKNSDAKIMKKIYFLLSILFLSISTFSQYKKRDNYIIGINAGLSKPISDLADVAQPGSDFRISVKWFMNKKIAVGIETGYIGFAQNDDFWDASYRGKNDVKYQLLPVLLIGHYFIQAWDRDFRPYVGIGFGYFFFRNKVEFTSSNVKPVPYNPFPSLEYKITESKFGLSPQVGFLYNIDKRWAIDLSARLTYVPNFPNTMSVEQKYTNVEDGVDDKVTVTDYKLGFTNLLSATLSIGLFYRF